MMIEPTNPAEYIAKSIPYGLTIRHVNFLTLGFAGDHINFDWRPYSERTPEAREDYDRLEADIRQNGILNPVIAYKDHVLIGMRRVEIARKLGIELVTVAQIDERQEDVSKWWKYDVERLNRLKEELKQLANPMTAAV